MVTSLFEDSLIMRDEQHNAASQTEDGVPVQRRVVGDKFGEVRVLDIAFLGCEEAVGYGPMEHTASIFLDLLCLAAESVSPQELWTISIHVYDAKLQQYPSQWSTFSGVILPGSYSSAYEENVPWIEKLKNVIQQVLLPRKIPTLGICFGHQIMAHSFYPNGKVAKLVTNKVNEADDKHEKSTLQPVVQSAVPKSRAGRISLRASRTGQILLGKDVMEFYATHGDYVEKLPDLAVCLGGDEEVPIQASAYYATSQEAEQARQQYSQEGAMPMIRPFAITFQSHLEYASSRDLGLHRTLELIMDKMANRGDFSSDLQQKMQQDARDSFSEVQQDSIDAMVIVGKLLGWFPA